VPLAKVPHDSRRFPCNMAARIPAERCQVCLDRSFAQTRPPRTRCKGRPAAVVEDTYFLDRGVSRAHTHYGPISLHINHHIITLNSRPTSLPYRLHVEHEHVQAVKQRTAKDCTSPVTFRDERDNTWRRKYTSTTYLNPYSFVDTSLTTRGRRNPDKASGRVFHFPFPQLFYSTMYMYHDPPNAHAMHIICMYVPGMYFPSVPSFCWRTT
jgi:hypothetical protein